MKKNILLCAALAALTACNGNSDNNKSLDYETIDVNFTLKSDLEIPEGTEFGVVALCARDGQQGVNMGEKPVASFKVSGTASPQRLAASSEEDKIQARESDHGFSFYAVSPYKNNVDVSAMQVSLSARQNYSDGIIKYLPMLAVKNVVSVLPDVEFDVKTPFSVLNLSVPADIVEEGVPATLKSLSFKPSDESLFQGALCGDGTMDIVNDKFTLTSGKGKSVTLDFPEGGLKIQAAGAVLPVVVLPFENPAGGFDITFTDINGKQYTTSFLNQDSDAGKVVASGDIVNVNVTRSSDGVVPVTFPVVFPLGVENDVRNFTETLQPKWVSTGYWSCPSQPQAYCQWNKVSDPSDKYQQKLETVNNGMISSPGVKGIWTGDNFEFVIPVKKFAAGTYLPAKGSWSSILLDGTHELITHMRNSTDGKNVGVILCKLALNHRIAASSHKVVIDGGNSDWVNADDALFAGSKCQAQATLRCAADADNIYFLVECRDENVSKDDYVQVFIAPSDAAKLNAQTLRVKVVDGKVKVNLALFDMEGGEDAIVSTGEKNPQKWITVTGL